MNLQWNRYLDEQTFLATGIKYNHVNHIGVERSLEKYYYDHYFGITDTTKGDVSYTGPNVFLSINRKIFNNFFWGLDMNYGVERGLKDIYTECETISRSSEISTGIGYVSPSGNTIIGASLRYFNRDSKYESVKKYEEAKLKTWFGYHLFYPEVPRMTVRKNDNREGYSVGLQMEQRLNSGLGIRLAGNYGEHKNDIEVGKETGTQQRGYWQREAWRLSGNLFYRSRDINTQLYYIMESNSDWAKPKTYQVLALEKDEIENRIGAVWDYRFIENFQLNCGFEFASIHQEYCEHAVDFNYDEVLNSSHITLGGKWDFNRISSIILSGNYGYQETDFHWPDTEKFDIIGAKIGYSRLFVLGRLDFDFSYTLFSPDNTDEQNEQFGIDIYLQR
jgi:hypothetical protein